VVADLEAWRIDTVDWLRDQGYSGATSERQSGDTVHLRGFRAPVAGDDLGREAMQWLAALPGFPAPLGELEVGEVKQIFDDSATVVIMRPRVGDVATALFRPVASAQLSRDGGGQWAVLSFTVWASTALLDEETAAALARCSPAEPPPLDAIRQTELEGLTMSWCAVVGDYSYRPDATDVVEFDEGIEWVAVAGEWKVRRHARLFVAEQNYWPDIAGADCWCDDVAGFELEVDANTGEILEYRPGINCVVC